MTKITHFITRNFIIFSCWFLPNVVTAQLDSTTASISVVENYYESADSLNQQNMAVLVVQFDDLSDLGFLSIVVYDDFSNTVLVELAKSREEWQASGFLLTDRLEYPLFEPLPEQTYRIEISPMNVAGAYTSGAIVSLTN